MTDYLKAQLSEILHNIANSMYYEGTSKEWFDEEVPELISKIDQAYKDAGYIYAPPMYHKVKRVLAEERISDAESKTINQAYRQYGLMTGWNWYDNFTKEIGSWGTGAYSGDLNSVLEAAKKAARLEE